MAEEKKPSRAERMYGKGNKIKDADSGSQKETSKPHAEAEKTAGKPERSEPSPKDSPAVKPAGGGGLDMADGSVHDIPMDEVHGREMRDLHDRHRTEMRDMHTRHEREHRALITRHDGEREGDKKPEENVGRAGTNPEKKAA